MLEIEVMPGWKAGTKIKFPHVGNEQPGGEAQDIVFVVEEKPHPLYTREGNDLVCHLKIPLVDALGGGQSPRTVNALDGRKLQVSVPSGIVKPGQETILRGEGMPIRKDGSVKTKGDLKIIWDVVFPEQLSSAQKAGVRKVLGWSNHLFTYILIPVHIAICHFYASISRWVKIEGVKTMLTHVDVE
jgi:DnaJ homolog subfamily B member 4